MPVYKVNVKWNKQVFNVELNTDEEPNLFKAQLYAITSVAIDRQKVLFKGKQIQDTWDNVQIKDGVTLLMMGSQEDIPKAPEKKTVFMEDLSENKLTELLQLPAGLDNLGNTCYINSIVQCLRTIPELCKRLKEMESDDLNIKSIFLYMLKSLYAEMDTKSTVEPSFLVTALLKVIPRFAENQQPNGLLQQQDANECLTEMFHLMKSHLKPIDNPIQDENAPKYDSFIDQYLGVVSESTMKCTETEEEEPTISKENLLQLSCFIDTDVKYLISGLKAKLEEKLTKHSSKLDKDAVYLKSSKIIRLPSYLCVQMVRYVYKEKESVSAKILKDIKFPMMLDVYELCSPALQEKLVPMRSKFKELEDKLAEKKDVPVNSGDQQKKDDKKDDKYVYPNYFKEDLGSNNSGFYDLQAVLTHKGRTSSTGHYVAWIKHKGTWFQCDDDIVSPVTEEEILKLSGGGDWHTAYVLFYGSRVLKCEKKEDGTPVV